MLIQGNDGKWYYRSKAGGNANGLANVDEGVYNSPEEFYKSPKGQRYKLRKRIPASLKNSQKVLDAVNWSSGTKYHFLKNNCDHLCKVGLRAGGIQHNNSTVPTLNWMSVSYTGF